MSDQKPSAAEIQKALLSDDKGVALMQILQATPVLLEIAATALAYQKAKITAARARARLARGTFRDDLSLESQRLDNEELRCRGAFVAALAMVRE